MNQKIKTKKTVIITVASVLAALILLFVILRFLPGKAVEVIPITDIYLNWSPDSTAFDGQISSESYQTVLYSKDRIGGKILVKDGDKVKIGDPLYKYDATADKMDYELKLSQIEKLGYEIEEARKEFKKYTKKEYQSTLPTPSPEPLEEIAKKTAGMRSAHSNGPVLLAMINRPILFEIEEQLGDGFKADVIINWLNNGYLVPSPIEWEETETKEVDGEEVETVYLYMLSIASVERDGEYRSKNYVAGSGSVIWNGSSDYKDFLTESGDTVSVKSISLDFLQKLKEKARNKVTDTNPLGKFEVILRGNDIITIDNVEEQKPMGRIYLFMTCTKDGEDIIDPDPTNVLTADEKNEKVQELTEKIQKAEVERKQLQLDVQKLLLKGMDGIIRAEINGVVAGVKDPAELKDGDVMLAVKGNGGLYVRCTVDENKLDIVQPGTKLTGMVYETGVSCDATVQEVSLVPVSTGENNYEYGRSATSMYEMRIKVEDDDKLTPGQYASFELESESKHGQGMYLQEAYVRTDGEKSYVYIVRNNVLKKMEVETGKNFYGYVEIMGSDITTSDYIAFPYGKNVVNGARVEIAK